VRATIANIPAFQQYCLTMRFRPLTSQQLRLLARGWMLVGSLLLVFISAMAIAHYAYGMPIEDRETGQLSTPANTLTTF
jgi:hypothetical protein